VLQSLKGDAVGDLGFDPIGISSWANMLYLREAEIKHGRKLPLYLCVHFEIFPPFPGTSTRKSSRT
jgi:hypothetical protein